MILNLDKKLIADYKSPSQKARVLTESWVDSQIFCPNCGRMKIDKYPNGRPVADFYCLNCKEDYELKSKQDDIGKKIVDGAYKTMIERLQSNENPNLFLLSYDLKNLEVLNFFVVPKHFFIPEIIEKRKTLLPPARRAGFTGCNILLNKIPLSGRIFLIRDQKEESKEKVLTEWKKTLFLREEKEISAKGWLLDIMRCIDKLGKRDFVLDDMYKFESELSLLYPENKHIKDKIRQQLQFLRDKGYLEFIGKGIYRVK